MSAVLLPTLCYQFNYHAFGKDGFLYPLVDKGGIFHFIVIGDYNFDGMNDELYHVKYDERDVSAYRQKPPILPPPQISYKKE